MNYFNNKNAYTHQIRRTNRIADIRTENCINATYNAYMLVALIVLYEKCGFREKRLTTFVTEFYNTVEAYQNGKLTYEDMKGRLSDYGIEFEPLQVRI